jgi:hypothetical protein
VRWRDQGRPPAEDTALTCGFMVGVAGFEPAASSSRIRTWKIADLLAAPRTQVSALVCVGLRWRTEASISRSSP